MMCVACLFQPLEQTAASEAGVENMTPAAEGAPTNRHSLCPVPVSEGFQSQRTPTRSLDLFLSNTSRPASESMQVLDLPVAEQQRLGAEASNTRMPVIHQETPKLPGSWDELVCSNRPGCCVIEGLRMLWFFTARR